MFDNLEPWGLDALDILTKRAARDHFCDEDHLFLLFVVPSRDEVNDVLVLKRFYQIYFRLYAHSVLLGETIQVNDIPSNLPPGVVVDSPVDYFIGTTS